MTISSEISKVQYAGDGSTVAFTVTYSYALETDIVVIHRDASAVETTWTNGTEYELSDPGTSGTVTVQTSPTDYTPASGETLTIVRQPPFTQNTDYITGGAVAVVTMEAGFDTVVREIHRLKEITDRMARMPETTASLSR